MTIKSTLTEAMIKADQEAILGDFTADMDMGGSAPSPDAGNADDNASASGDLQRQEHSFNPADDKAPPAPPQKTEGGHDYEKRFKDTQKAFQEEHQKRIELERSLNELKAQVQQFSQRSQAGETTARQDKAIEDALSSFSTEFEEDPKSAIEKALKHIAKATGTVREEARAEAIQAAEIAARQRQIEASEKAIRKEKPDYDQFVDEAFINRLRSSAELQQQWQRSGGDAAAAYELARREKAMAYFHEHDELPDWYSKKKAPSPSLSQAPRTLAGVSSAGAPPPRRGNQPVFDSADDAWDTAFLGRK